MDGRISYNPNWEAGWSPTSGKKPYSNEEVMNHFIKGYHVGYYSTPGEVLDAIKYHRANNPYVGVLPKDFEDTTLAHMGFRQVIDNPLLPTRIEKIPGSDTGVQALVN